MIDFANTITTKQDLEKLIRMLVRDFHENKSEWENISLEDFLSAMSRYVSDLKETDAQGNVLSGNQPSWKLFGELLLAAKVYE